MSNGFKKVLVNRLMQPVLPFYRRYPYRGRVSMNSADDRGCVDFGVGFFCNRIPKAANSSVITSLARLKTGEDVPSKAAKKLFRTPASLSSSELEQFEKLFKFAVVRNPYTRTLSAFLDKVERRALRRGESASFADFIAYLESNGLYSNAHWAPQSSLLLIPKDNFDFFGKVESFDADMEAVLRKLRNPTEEHSPNSMLSNATGATERMKQYYTPELADRVRKLFQEDFEAFGYSDQLVLDD